MSVRVPGTGPLPCRVLLIGERPGFEEVTARRPQPFIGPSGRELWQRLWQTTGLARSDVRVTNLVKTFSPDPPSAEEVARDWPDLHAEMLRCRPELIVTLGYHAARALLPQFAAVTGDLFHGLPWPYRLGTLAPRAILVLPVVHPSAALHSPGRYQQQLTDDLRAVGQVLSGGLVPRVPVVPPVTACALAAVRGEVVALDTEGSIYRPWQPEAISLSAGGHAAALAEGDWAGVQEALDAAGTVTIHHLKHDIKALHAAGLTLHESKWEDTMVMAALLGLPQGLKGLMAREFGWQMQDYWDLMQPLDDALVTSTLQDWHDERQRWLTSAQLSLVLLKATLRRRKEQAPHRVAAAEARVARAKSRALTSIRKVLTTTTEATKRERWEGSTFSELVPLPPRPTWKDLPDGVRQHYARLDAVAHRHLRQELWGRIERDGLERAYRVDMGVLPWLVRNEEVGLACDGGKLALLAEAFRADLDDLRVRINERAGREVNPMSGAQVSECLFSELGITPTKLTPSRKHHLTSDKYLKARRPEHDIIQLILNARQLNKYLGTYAEKLPSMLQDGRLYPNWKYTRTATGRLAEEVILLIPKHDPLAKAEGRENRAKAIRNCFHAAPGNLLVSVDLSQIELRVMAHVAGETAMLDAFHRGEDFHAQVAHRLLGAPERKEDQDDSAHRLPAKTVTYGIINGMTEYGMVDQLHEAGQLQWTIEDVRAMLDEWFLVYGQIRNFWDGEIEKAQSRGYVESMYGRRRYLAGVQSVDERIRKESERQCLFYIQSTADEISKVWGRRMWRTLIKPLQQQGIYCEPWVRVHDDTTLEVAASHAKEVGERMLALIPQLLDIPTTGEVKMGEQWGDLH